MGAHPGPVRPGLSLFVAPPPGQPESLSEPVRSLPDTSRPGREGPRPGSAESLDRTPGINGAHPRLFKEIPQNFIGELCFVSCPTPGEPASMAGAGAQ